MWSITHTARTNSHEIWCWRIVQTDHFLSHLCLLDKQFTPAKTRDTMKLLPSLVSITITHPNLLTSRSLISNAFNPIHTHRRRLNSCKSASGRSTMQDLYTSLLWLRAYSYRRSRLLPKTQPSRMLPVKTCEAGLPDAERG